ncbi:MAG: lasso peptide biosynthesis B2 protein [Candidatus Acidiferrales bacterium]
MKKATRTWRRFWRLSGYARARVLEAAGGLLLTRICLSVAGFRRWKAAIEWLTPDSAAPGSPATQPEMEFAGVMDRWEAAAARHLPMNANCLERSLTLWWLLRRRGIAAELCIGGRKERGQFEAHAWVEVGGVIVSDKNGGRGEFEVFGARPGAIRTCAS